MVVVAISAVIVPAASSFEPLLACAFLPGLAGSSFAVGAGSVSGCASPDRQGTALGVYGLLLIVKMWLLTATLEAHLAGHPEPIRRPPSSPL
jgi:nitrate/nitrite transporter NarK